MIPFNKPTVTGQEQKYILEALKSPKLSGDGFFSSQCQTWFENTLPCTKSILTPSCTAALEMAAILIDITPGDEIIMPSYTFVSTANAFVLRGAKIIFVDVRPDTMNIDEQLIEQAITKKTKAIVPVHYAGVACEMDTIMGIAKKHNLFVIEDAAQGLMSTYKGRALGTIGDFGAFSFHETKNYTSGGEGGLLVINNLEFLERAEIVHEKGTNRKQFFRGETNKYEWVDVGSSYLMSEVQAAYLWAQLEHAENILANRLACWKVYYDKISESAGKEYLKLPKYPRNTQHNGHIFYIKVANKRERSNLIQHLKKSDISAVFHYVPLHSSPAGKEYGQFYGEDKYTTPESERLIRLPIWHEIPKESIERVSECISSYFRS